MRSHKTLALVVGIAISACGPKVATIGVQPGSATLSEKGKTTKLSATAKDSEGKEVKEGVTLAFSSSDPAVATVDPASGLVTAVSSGDAVITAAFQEKKGEATVRVSIPASLSIVPADVKLAAVGAKATLSVKVLDAKGRPVAAEVAFASPSDKVVSVNQGELTAVGPGEGEVVVSAGGVTGKVKVSVTLPPAAEVEVEKAVLELKAAGDEPVKIVATAKDEAKQPIVGAVLTYSSDNEKVAKVDEAGAVTAVGKGKAKITVASGEKKAEVAVKVK
jgi:hypothetical protein